VAQHEALLKDLDEASIDDQQCTPGRLFVRNFGRAIYQTIITYIADNRHLLEQPAGLDAGDDRNGRSVAGER